MKQRTVKIVPIILAGGSGTRLWPASRVGSPKQYLALLGGPSLIQATYRRVHPLGDVEDLVVVTVQGHEDLVAAALPDLPATSIWTEPVGRNTAPSIAWALHELQDRHADHVAVFFPADHMVADEEAFRRAVRQAAAAAAAAGQVGLLGVPPTGPETGYGYVEAASHRGGSVREVVRFLEKPDAQTAADLMRRPEMYWNSGIFAIPVAPGLRLVRQAAPDLETFLERLPAAGTGCRVGLPGREELAQAFQAAAATPFDVAVMEKTSSRLLVPLEAGWSDLGTWQAVWEQGQADGDGNVLGPGGRAVDSSGCLITGDGPPISVLGARDLVVVAWGGQILVCPRERAQDVRRLARGRE